MYTEAILLIYGGLIGCALTIGATIFADWLKDRRMMEEEANAEETGK